MPPRLRRVILLTSQPLYRALRVRSRPVLFLCKSLQPDPVNAKASANKRWREIRAFCGKSHKEVFCAWEGGGQSPAKSLMTPQRSLSGLASGWLCRP